MDGLRNGFSLVDIDPMLVPHACTPNHPSAVDSQHRHKVEARILEEIEDGNYKLLNAAPTMVSPLAVVPKPNGDIRLIHDLSRPHDKSLNDFATKDPCKYITVEEAISNCVPGSYLATLDLQWAYRSISIRDSEHTLMMENPGLK